MSEVTFFWLALVNQCICTVGMIHDKTLGWLCAWCGWGFAVMCEIQLIEAGVL